MPAKWIKPTILLLMIGGMLYLTACSSRPDKDNISSEDSARDTVNLSGETKPGNDSNPDEPEADNLSTYKNQDIAFVQQDYFYQDTAYIEIDSDRPCDIYYTMDGSDPDKSQTPYQDKIELKSSADTEVYCIKAKGYYEDGTETDTIVQTYFVGKGVHDRFDTLVFSITSDPYNLYDYEYGILIEGKLRDDFVKNNPFKNIEPPDPANFNMRGRESEREVYLEIFEPDGAKVVSQKTGIRVYGGWSRANLQKSLKIFARRSYDDVNNKIRYEFFPDRKSASGAGTIISEFKRLVLRNTGNDNGFGFIRDELFQALAGQAGYRDYESVRPAAVFINGEYRGHLWLHEVYCDEYFEQHYGEYAGTFEILEGGETYKKSDEDEANGYAIADYEEAYSYTYQDLTDDAVYNKLCEVIDVENYLEYYALQIHIGNEDWPHNNYKVYRYFAAEGEEYKEAPFDGKWRYLLHDLDFSFGIYGSSPWTDNLQKYASKVGNLKNDSPLFSQLLRREDCKEFFITRTLDLINGAFSPENLNKVLDEMNTARMNEQLHMYDKNLISDWVRPEFLPEQIENIKNFGASRVLYTLGKYRDFFNLGEVYRLNVKPADGAGVQVNGITAYSEYEGSYYPDYDTVLSAIVPAGEELDYWLVNKEPIYTQELIVNASMVVNKRIEVACVFKKKAENVKIIIREIYSNQDRDYIMLYNPYKEDISMMGYSITDDVNEPGKLILPARTLKSGESIKIIGESNKEESGSGMIRAGFNLGDGETVALYLNGEAVEMVTIPDLKRGSTYLRDLKTNKFYEVRN